MGPHKAANMFGYIFWGYSSSCSQAVFVENEFTSAGTLTENKYCED